MTNSRSPFSPEHFLLRFLRFLFKVFNAISVRSTALREPFPGPLRRLPLVLRCFRPIHALTMARARANSMALQLRGPAG